MEIVLTLLTWFMTGWIIFHFAVLLLGTFANYAMTSMARQGKIPEQKTIDKIYEATQCGVRFISPRLVVLILGTFLVWGAVTAVVVYVCNLIGAKLFLNSARPFIDVIKMKGIKINEPQEHSHDFHA